MNIAGHHSMMGGGKALPFLHKLEYIQSQGRYCYIDTLINSSLAVSLAAKYAPHDTAAERAFTITEWAANDFFLMCYNRAVRWHLTASGSMDYGSVAIDRPVEIEAGNGWLKVDGSLKNGQPLTSLTPKRIYIFSKPNLPSGNGGTGQVRMYYHKLFNSGVLIQHLIPVLDFNNIACAYDMVSGNLFYSAGSAGFTPGPII